MIVKQAAKLARFNTEKMGKCDLLSGKYLFSGLNAFEAGQVHAPHAHCDRDKLYVVLEGSGQLTIGDESQSVSPGDVALAPADVEHSLANPGPARLVVMTVMAPPPGK